MPLVLQILCWSILCLACIFLLIRIHIVAIVSVFQFLHWWSIGLWSFILVICISIIAILTLIPVDISGLQAKPLECSCGPSSLAGSGDDNLRIAFINIIFVIPAAPWYPEMLFLISAIVVYGDVWVSASNLRLLRHHFGGQIVKTTRIVNMSFLHPDDHGRRWVLRLLDLTHDCCKVVFIHPLLVALW